MSQVILKLFMSALPTYANYYLGGLCLGLYTASTWGARGLGVFTTEATPDLGAFARAPPRFSTWGQGPPGLGSLGTQGNNPRPHPGFLPRAMARGPRSPGFRGAQGKNPKLKTPGNNLSFVEISSVSIRAYASEAGI